MSKKKTEESSEPVYIGPMASSSHRAVRETIESIVIAFILAFLFRTFEAEAFVIPTGSMAPTLHGMHKDLECPQCGIAYRVGASKESDEEASRQNRRGVPVVEGVCPQCGFVRRDLAGEPSFGGDRILVNKFAYQLGEPERWDVIVFRFPGDAKMNYIKRLVGLPSETIKIHGGDIFTAPNPIGDAPFVIARKSHRKLRAMLQHVDDNHHIAKTLDDAGWPRRWQSDPDNPPGALEESLDEHAFSVGDREAVRLAQRWTSDGSNVDRTAYIDFQHFFAGRYDAERRRDGQKPDWVRAFNGPVWLPDELVESGTVYDFYSYNTDDLEHLNTVRFPEYWVGDLAMECEVEIEELQGELTLAVEEGGYQFRAVFDLEGGGVTLEIEKHGDANANIRFGDDGSGPSRVVASDAIVGTGKHKLMLANCDDKLFVWVDDVPVEFDGPTEFAPLGNTRSTEYDIVPAHIGVRGFKGALSRIQIRRDVFYTPMPVHPRHDESEDETRPLVFHTGADQFFTLGDNSPSSQDGRIWNDAVPGTPHVVDRRLLIGKALLIYWPYGRLLPRWPLFERMKLIR